MFKLKGFARMTSRAFWLGLRKASSRDYLVKFVLNRMSQYNIIAYTIISLDHLIDLDLVKQLILNSLVIDQLVEEMKNWHKQSSSLKILKLEMNRKKHSSTKDD